MAIHNPKSNNDFNFMNSDTMPLDIRGKPEYDNEEIMPLDARIKYEHDKTDFNSINKDIHSNWIFGSSTNMTKMINQSGRSMVEMLGVLAVIGVLSIGGIMGYSYGMDKYRANETTNQIMLRAIDLIAQAAEGNETLSLAGWTNEQTQYDFGTPEYTDDNLIVFDVGINEKMPKRVCEIVYDALKDMAVQIDINATRADSNDTCGDDNEMSFYFEGSNDYTCNPACPAGQYCDNGICFRGNAPEGTIMRGTCSNGTDCNVGWTGTCALCSPEGQCRIDGYDGDDCTLTDGTAGQCNLGRCYPKGCTSNADCKETGTYCASPNSSFTERFPSGTMGSCAPVDFSRHEIAGQIYYISNGPISWWDAEFACESIGGKKLLGVDDLVTATDGSKWQGGGAGTYPRTQLAIDLNDAIGNHYVWTEKIDGNGYAANVRLKDGNIDSHFNRTGTRNYKTQYLAVCK